MGLQKIRNAGHGNWLPFYRPCSFASHPFGCFAKMRMQLSETKKPPKIHLGGTQKTTSIHVKTRRLLPDGIKGSGTPDAVTGCHFTGPVALRHTLSSALPK